MSIDVGSYIVHFGAITFGTIIGNIIVLYVQRKLAITKLPRSDKFWLLPVLVLVMTLISIGSNLPITIKVFLSLIQGILVVIALAVNKHLNAYDYNQDRNSTISPSTSPRGLSPKQPQTESQIAQRLALQNAILAMGISLKTIEEPDALQSDRAMNLIEKLSDRMAENQVFLEESLQECQKQGKRLMQENGMLRQQLETFRRQGG